MLKDRLNAEQTKWNIGSGAGTPADPSGAVPRDGALNVGSRRCCQPALPGGKSVHTGKAGETAATAQTGEREKQSAASLEQAVVRQESREEAAAAAPSCAAATQGPLQRVFY